MTVIPNGVDTELFRPDPAARAGVLDELRLPRHTRLIGMFARAHPHKDYLTFIQAAGSMAEVDAAVHFVLAGSGVDSSNRRLHDSVEALGLGKRVHLLGARADMPHLMAAMDIVTLSSRVEALPVTLEEAMACSKPCVATDVGECSKLLEGTGLVVQPGDVSALAKAWQQILALPQDVYDERGAAARRRIVENYSAAGMNDGYKRLYRSLIASRKETAAMTDRR